MQVVRFKQPTSEERAQDFLGALTCILPRGAVSRSTTVRTMRMYSLSALVSQLPKEALEPRSSSGSLIGRN